MRNQDNIGTIFLRRITIAFHCGFWRSSENVCLTYFGNAFANCSCAFLLAGLSPNSLFKIISQFPATGVDSTPVTAFGYLRYSVRQQAAVAQRFQDPCWAGDEIRLSSTHWKAIHFSERPLFRCRREEDQKKR